MCILFYFLRQSKRLKFNIMNKLEEIIEQFSDADFQETLELLLDYSEDLPAIPEKFSGELNKEANRVPECETPVYVWVDINNNIVDIYADVAPESPTVKGLVSILVTAFNGVSPEEVESAPQDLLTRLGLAQKLGTRRMFGLGAVYNRIKNEVKNKAMLQ